MLDRLLETTDNGRQTKKMRKFLMGIGSLMTTLFVCGLIFSIFSTNLAMGGESIELSNLLAPAMIPENAPPPPETRSNPKETTDKTVSNETVRVLNMQRPEESPVAPPKTVSTVANKYRARPEGDFKIDPGASDVDAAAPGTSKRPQNNGGSIGGFGNATDKTEKALNKPVETDTSVGPPPKLETKATVVSHGVVNGKAKTLVKPLVTGAIRMSGIKGTVTVNVLISETGKVLTASAASGHALLRPPAVTAALRSTFSPTLLSGVPVQVRGIIVYNYK